MIKYGFKINNKRNIWFDGVTTFIIRIIHKIRLLVQALNLIQVIYKLSGRYFCMKI